MLGQICDDAPVEGGAVRLALDVAPVRGEPAGVGVYVSQLACCLSAAGADGVAFIGARSEARALDLIGNGNARLPFRAPHVGRRSIRSYHAWLQMHADSDARAAGAQLVHYTNASAPLRATLPYVLTVHDLSILRMPHQHPATRLATVPFMLAAIARAQAVVVPSDAIRRELTERLRVAAGRCVTIEHAAAEVVDGVGPNHILERLGVQACNYLLTVGTLEPRKNIVRLVGAFERLARVRPGLKLVLVGASGWRRGAIERRIADSPMRDDIIVPGYLPGCDVTALIRSAAAFCYVSLYEGYGLPVIEALAAGAAVVTSNRSGMIEAAGGAAVLVDPLREDDIARGIGEALERRSALIVAGRERAARRRWADVATEHASVYRWAAARAS